MYEQFIEEIQTESARLATVQRTSIDTLQSLGDDDTSIDFSISINVGDRSISDLDTLTSSLVKFANGFREDKNWSFVPRIWINDFREALKNTANSYENLTKNLAAVDSEHGGLESIEPATFSITTKSGTVLDLRKILANISTNIDNGYAGYFRMRPAISAPRLTEFDDLFSFFASRRTELDTLSKELSRLGAQGRESAEAAKIAAEAVAAAQKEATKLNADTTKSEIDARNAASKATEILTSIQKTQTAADELSESVEAYQTTFEQFQTKLDARNNDYTNKKAAFEKLKTMLDEEGERIEKLSNQADDMLKGATNAGLAGSYSNKQIDVEKEIRKARTTYYISIGLLVFLTLPIFIYSFPKEYVVEFFQHILGLKAPTMLARDTTQTDYQQFLNFIGRAVFLIPGLMFVRFASTRHAQLFRLREDYAYKYSIASSVDGFMKQAKAYSDDIAAACYYELTYNPAEHMDGKADDARMLNPLFERMMSRLEARIVKHKAKSGNAA